MRRCARASRPQRHARLRPVAPPPPRDLSSYDDCPPTAPRVRWTYVRRGSQPAAINRRAPAADRPRRSRRPPRPRVGAAGDDHLGSGRQRKDVAAARLGRTRRRGTPTVAEYLLAEMLDRQPGQVQDLLLRTSLLNHVNGELADLLTGRPGSEGILLELEDANAFVLSLDPGRTWFRFHQLFGDMLRLELRRTLVRRRRAMAAARRPCPGSRRRARHQAAAPSGDRDAARGARVPSGGARGVPRRRAPAT